MIVLIQRLNHIHLESKSKLLLSLPSLLLYASEATIIPLENNFPSLKRDKEIRIDLSRPFTLHEYETNMFCLLTAL